MVSRFTIETVANVAPAGLFDASLSIDAHLESMSRSGERAIGGVTTGRIGLGESVTWRARHFGIWFTMTSRITALDRPDRFVDEQVRGPFRVFRHEHLFERIGGVTVMTDVLTIGSPIFGRFVERIILVPYLRRLIRGRNTHLVQRVDTRFGTLRRGFDARSRAIADRLQRWDVLGVYADDDGPDDDEEYDDLVSPIRSMLEAGAGPAALSAGIVDVLRCDYGLSYDDDLAEIELANDLDAWWRSL